jgi:hypothetical protein
MKRSVTLLNKETPPPKMNIMFDIEATGDFPGDGSMVMIGMVAFLDSQEPGPIDDDSWIYSKLEVCIEETSPKRNERCWSDFWTKNMHVWEHIQKNKIQASEAMTKISSWLESLSLSHTIEFFAQPAAYDWQWFIHYYCTYGQDNRFPIPHKAHCTSSLRLIPKLIGKIEEYDKFISTERYKHTHFALEDATRQAFEYIMAKEWFKKNMIVTQPPLKPQ